ncbi:MAG: ribonuclease III [Chthonomonadales bacterium]|nr:ribonuclease III [Chthonomonadales bacterium]
MRQHEHYGQDMQEAASEIDPEELATGLHVRFRDPSLLQLATTHRSRVPDNPLASYERLEFLGDAVVGLVVAEWLYSRYPELSEGELALRRTRLVNREALARATENLGIQSLSALTETLGHCHSRGRLSIRADLFEALIGAVFIDRGYRTARRIVRAALRGAFRSLAMEPNTSDPKSRLQELTQARWRVLPAYEIAPREGSAHQPLFRATVSIRNQVIAHGSGASKKEAERDAAAAALGLLEESS